MVTAIGKHPAPGQIPVASRHDLTTVHRTRHNAGILPEKPAHKKISNKEKSRGQKGRADKSALHYYT